MVPMRPSPNTIATSPFVVQEADEPPADPAAYPVGRGRPRRLHTRLRPRLPGLLPAERHLRIDARGASGRQERGDGTSQREHDDDGAEDDRVARLHVE
jgi:hypothetical protein